MNDEKKLNIAQKLYLEPTIGKHRYAELTAALNLLVEAADREKVPPTVWAAIRDVLAAANGWTPVSAPAFPSYIGGRRDLIDVIDSSIGLVGGFLRALPSRDDNRTRTDKAHRAFERFAARIVELYSEDLDDLEEEYRREADERAEDAAEATPTPTPTPTPPTPTWWRVCGAEGEGEGAADKQGAA